MSSIKKRSLYKTRLKNHKKNIIFFLKNMKRIRNTVMMFCLSGWRLVEHDGAVGDDVYPVPGAAALLLPLQEGAQGRLLPHHEDHPRLPLLHHGALQPHCIRHDGPGVRKCQGNKQLLFDLSSTKFSFVTR